MEYKICSACKVCKTLCEFYKQKSSKDGLQSYCKACSKKRYKPSTKVNDIVEIRKKKFISDSINFHGDTYGYERVEYVRAHAPVEIFCNKHRDYFWQTPTGHRSGRGCPICAMKEGHEKLRFTREEFIEKAVSVHGDRYTCENSVYSYNYVPLKVTCKVHGDFMIAPSNLFMGKGCSKCSTYGYSTEKPGTFYILVCDDIVKVGVTNRDIDKRLSEINKSSKKNFTVFHSETWQDGAIALSIEFATLVMLRAHEKKLQEKFDGSTECFIGVDVEYLSKLLDLHKKVFKDKYGY